MPYDTEIDAADRPMLIDNVWRAGGGGEWLPILNPVDESLLGRFAVATTTDLDEALASA